MRINDFVPLVALALITACAPDSSSTGAAESLASGLGSARTAGDLEHSLGLRLADAEHGGRAGSLHLVGLSWGRLADVYARAAENSPPTLVARDFVIGELRSERGEWIVETEPITNTTSVTILHPKDSAEFARALAELESGLVPIDEKSLELAELPPFSMVPRNAAIVARFDDLLDAATIAGSIEVQVGAPPITPHPVRVLPDPNHGGYADRDGDGALEFHPTRVILDLAVSELEARASAEVIGMNPLGLPPGQSASIANVVVRLATAKGSHLTNLAGRALHPRENGSVAPGAHGLDVIRAFRSGGPDDLFEGLLADTDPPRVVGRQAVSIVAGTPDPAGGPNDYLVDLTFGTPTCAQAVASRDVVDALFWVGIVTQASAAPVGNALSGVHVRLIFGPTVIAPLPAELFSVYDPSLDAGQEACFVQFVPAPVTLPARGVPPSAQMRVSFNEPLDDASVDAFDALQLTRVAAPDSPDDYVAAQVAEVGAPVVTYELTPLVPLDHVQGQAEVYFFRVRDTIRDLAGNALAAPLAQFSFRLDPAVPTLRTGNHVLRFDSTDEDGNGKPELRGQFLNDLAAGLLRPRAVTRYAAIADRTQAIPGLMHPFLPGVQTPLSPLGSKLHTLYRYCDVGFALLDETNDNVDVEGLDWAPAGGAAVADQFDEFEISLSHGKFLPDELIDSLSLLPLFPLSGIVATYAQNQLDPINDPLKVVHPRQLGYTVSPADLFVAQTGTIMMPYPLNRGIPASQYQYYTWRDTALQAKGASGDGPGAELGIVSVVLGTGQPGVPYPNGQVPTIGLPLLMEFKCFPDSGALGLNAFDVSLAINSSARPNFRAFSTGGVNALGQVVTKNPDLELVASGGFNPSSTPPGAATLGTDNVFHIGQLDLVIRVSRAHGIWIDAQSVSPSFASPVVAPKPSDQPAGTDVLLAWRGATTVQGPIGTDAGQLDQYGDPRTPLSGTVVFFQGDATWKPSLAALDGARYVQPRITFIANAATGDTPVLSGLGIAFTH